ncbi:DoxX family protein [Rhizosphaericola mali]|uniref:DoxX family membrane protein n=1 Tax=Rhizosphaericola mali TaxID=2545455 RepID=A0A5P2GA85_9BACT|nr:DoxX family membrane protein [Rhizosphaericola mali]QES88461.1 DoxX family membrane protein [Rhizosphaericola mali]
MHLPWHQYLFGTLFILAGLNHFRKPRMYIKIIPPIFKNKKMWNILAGVGEIVLGIGMIVPMLSNISAWGIIVLLIAIFPANIYMYTHEEVSMGLSKTLRLIRLPFQFVLIAWAWLYT